MKKDDKHRYDDLIDLPHHVSARHPQMRLQDRAAQFAPFAALTGHGEAVKETARLTEAKIELDEDCKAKLDEKLRLLREKAGENLEVCITYFERDLKKSGGTYVTAAGIVKKIDEYEQCIVLNSGERIAVGDVVKLEGKLSKMI